MTKNTARGLPITNILYLWQIIAVFCICSRRSSVQLTCFPAATRFWNGKEQEVRKIIPVLFIVLAFLAVSCDAEFPSPEDEFDYNFSDRIETPDAVEPSEKANELINELSSLCDKIDSQTLENQKTTESTNAGYIYTDSSNQLAFRIKHSRQTINGNGLEDIFIITGDGFDDSGNTYFKNNTSYHVIRSLSDGGIARTVSDTTVFIDGKLCDGDLSPLEGEFMSIFNDESIRQYEMLSHSINTRSGSLEGYSVEYEEIRLIASVDGTPADFSSKRTFSFSPEYGEEKIAAVISYNDEAVELQGSSDLAGTYSYSGFASSSD